MNDELDRLRAENWELILKIIDMERAIRDLGEAVEHLEIENQYLRRRRGDTA